MLYIRIVVAGSLLSCDLNPVQGEGFCFALLSGGLTSKLYLCWRTIHDPLPYA